MAADPVWSLCPARAEDGVASAELRAVVTRPSLPTLGRYDAHRVRHRFLDGYRPDLTRVSAYAGSIAACVEPDAVWIEHFSLAPHAQGRGVGGAVLRRVMQEEARPGLASASTC
ncbi:GNAT family N-acetyltransferase [Rathayibacter rathayi]|uniref:GNAT family N-acetyltransferase n=1 Tax=Rathayibacter rathayi TaxID=33887 RepID=UPI0015E1C511|nr:GNAT family N-acetyltransferase [Rathayibacter rathayi]